MTPLQKVSIWFLLLVSIAYIALGLIIFQLTFEWDLGAMIIELTGISGYGILSFTSYLRYVGLVFPIGVANIGFAAATNFELVATSLLSLIVGILGIVGVLLMRRKVRAGYYVWQFLIALAVGISLWNLIWVYQQHGIIGYLAYPFRTLSSSLWTVLYYKAYRITRGYYAII